MVWRPSLTDPDALNRWPRLEKRYGAAVASAGAAYAFAATAVGVFFAIVGALLVGVAVHAVVVVRPNLRAQAGWTTAAAGVLGLAAAWSLPTFSAWIVVVEPLGILAVAAGLLLLCWPWLAVPVREVTAWLVAVPGFLLPWGVYLCVAVLPFLILLGPAAAVVLVVVVVGGKLALVVQAGMVLARGPTRAGWALVAVNILLAVGLRLFPYPLWVDDVLPDPLFDIPYLAGWPLLSAFLLLRGAAVIWPRAAPTLLPLAWVVAVAVAFAQPTVVAVVTLMALLAVDVAWLRIRHPWPLAVAAGLALFFDPGFPGLWTTRAGEVALWTAWAAAAAWAGVRGAAWAAWGGATAVAACVAVAFWSHEPTLWPILLLGGALTAAFLTLLAGVRGPARGRIASSLPTPPVTPAAPR